MPPTLRLFLVRHGQVAANRELRYVGRSDESLTELGRQQAENLATAFTGLPISRIISSPLRRATATAEYIARATGVAVVGDDRLREQFFGEWEGLSRQEVKERSAEDRARLGAWEGDPGIAPPGGDSLLAVQERTVDLVDELGATAAAGDRPWIVLVSHVGPIKALLAASLDISLLSGRRIFLDPGTVSVVDWGERSIVRLCNSYGPAGWGGARWMQERS